MVIYLNNHLEKLLQIIIDSSTEHDQVNINELVPLVNQPQKDIMRDVLALQEQKLVVEAGNGYIIRVTPLGHQYFETKHDKKSAQYWTEFRVHFVYPTITFVVGTLLGFLFGKSF